MVFLSYRRTDSADVAGRLFDQLSQRFGKEKVFKDVVAILPGRDFRKAIEDALGSCSVMVALIGSMWVSSTDDSGKRRLDNPEDYVRIELTTALKRGIPVIPVLVGGAALPGESDLPSEVAHLAFNQCMPLRGDPDFHNDAARLIKTLESWVAPATGKRALQEAFHFAIQVQPIDGAKRVDLGAPYGAVYVGGCKFSITLSNTGQYPLVVTRMRAEVTREKLPELTLKKEERAYGGVIVPHQLHFELFRDYWSGWWLFSAGDKLLDTRYDFTNQSADLFDSPGSPRIKFRIGPQEREMIEGSIMPRDDGAYAVRLVALASDAALQKTAKACKPIRVAKARLE